VSDSARRSDKDDDQDTLETPASFGVLLRQHRIAAGLTQEAMAERAGLAVRGIQDLEGGRHRPHRQTVKRLARALALSGDRQSAFEEASNPSPRRGGAVAPIRLIASDAGRSSDLARTNFGQPLTSFVGRGDDLARIRSLLKTSRLLTLTGAGGCGKTRLALQAASSIAADFPGGATLVELAALVDSKDVAEAIVVALGLRERPGASTLQVLVGHLRNRPALLLLDNCEQVIDGCAAIVAALLMACPSLTVLATSREPLRTSGEVNWRVPSLAVPLLDSPDILAADPAQLVLDYSAMRLFLDRAKAAYPSFRLTRQNVLPVARICSQVDGIPLAIELAAALVGDLSVDLLAERLRGSFALLTHGDRAAPPRQRTLQATIDWSFGQLSELEHCLFRRLAVFSGGFTLDAAEYVAVGGELDHADVLPWLIRLVDKSLIVAEEGDGGAVRYRLLETLRQYAWTRLEEAGEDDAVRARHRDWFLALAEQAEPKLWGINATTVLRRLEADHANLRVALEWCYPADACIGLRLAASLRWFWVRRGFLAEGSYWLRTFLRLAPAQAAERSSALLGAGVLARDQGDLVTATRFLEESLQLCREAGDREGIARSLSWLGLQNVAAGDYQRANLLLQESLDVARGIPNRTVAGFALGHLGNLARLEGNLAGARLRLEEMLQDFQEDGDPLGIAIALHDLGELAAAEGDYRTARAYLRDELARRRDIGDRVRIASPLSFLGDLTRLEGDYSPARALLEEALRIYQDSGAREDGGILASLGDLARLEGDLPRAILYHRESLARLQIAGDKRQICRSIDLFALVVVEQGAPSRALRLFAGARANAPGAAPFWPAEQACRDAGLAAARTQLTEEAAARAWFEGHEMTLDQVIAEALGSTEGNYEPVRV
jgi:predicted ATPase/DNA-binding XRE family transcriptional regulator